MTRPSPASDGGQFSSGWLRSCCSRPPRSATDGASGPCSARLTWRPGALWAAIAGAALAVAALGLWLAHRRGGGGIAALGLALWLSVLFAAGAWQYATRTTPPINDIPTNTDDPPVFWFTATPSDSPAQNAGPQRAVSPDVRPLELPVAADEAFAAALALVEDRGCASPRGPGRHCPRSGHHQSSVSFYDRPRRQNGCCQL